MTPLSWEHWVERYGSRGFKVLAPGWPGMDVGEEQLRRDPSPIARQSVAEILNNYERIIRVLERPPIIMGHFSAADHAEISVVFVAQSQPAL